MVKFFSKEFLFGLGAGFIISAMLISVFGTGQISEREILERASKLGMIMKDTNTANSNTALKVYSDKTAPDITKADNNSSPTRSNDDNNNNTSSKDTGSTETDVKPAVPENAESSAVSSDVKKVSITVNPGMGSETIARLLEEKGAVKDRNEFYQVVTEMKAHTRFRTGTFTIPADGDMKEIVRIMTGKK